MTRPTVAALAEQVAALTAEVAALRAHIDATSPVQYVRELLPPAPISTPIDFAAMSDRLGTAHAAYDEAGDVWGPGVYL